MFQNGIATPEAITRSFIGALALLLVLMLVVGGLGLSGATFLTAAIWLSILGVAAVAAFLIVRAQRPYAGAGAMGAALAVWMAYFWRSNPGPLLWPVVFIIAVGLIAYGTRQDTSMRYG